LFQKRAVANDTYKGGGNKDLDFRGKIITVKSENGPANCIIDCEGAGRGFYFDTGEGPNAEVSGFTIRNGYVFNGGGIYIYNGSPTISNCIITDNEATRSSGGGIYVGGYYPRITNCTITNNTAYVGGGLYSAADGGMVTNCTINNNTARTKGGGIYSYSADDVFTDCAISGNYAEDGGGGIYCISSSADFNRCTIQNNRTGDAASYGGGVYVYSSSANTFTNCIVTGNSAYDDGGGFYLSSASPTITNCTVSGNSVDSAGGGVYFYSSSTKIWNSIFWGNTPNEFYVYSGTPEVHYTDIQGGYSGTGTIDSDPLFVGNGDYHLTSAPTASPCIDTGWYSAPELPSTDKDENARIIGSQPDMGAYEYEKYAPTVSTGVASSVTGSTANLNGTINPNGAISYYWFQFGTTTGYGSNTAYTNVVDGKSAISVSFPQSGLSSNTTYHYRMAAMSYGGTSYGSDQTFKTPAVSNPTVTTTAVSSITSTSATSGGNVTADGGASVTSRGVCWSTTPNPTIANSKTTNGTGTGSFTSSITGLTPGTPYHVRAYATNSAGTGYGSDVSFTTSYAANRYVCSDGYCGGKTPCNRTVSEAVAAAGTGTLIKIAAEEHNGNFSLSVDKDLTLQGGWDKTFNNPNGGTTTLHGAPKAPQGSLTLQNLNIKP